MSNYINTSRNNFANFVRELPVRDFGANNTPKPTLDKIIKESQDIINKQNNSKPSFALKLLTHPSLTSIPLLPLLVGEIYTIGKALHLKKQVKQSKIPKKQLAEYVKTIPKKILLLGASAVPIYFAVDFLNGKIKDKQVKNSQKQVDYFNQKTGTDVKFANQSIGSAIVGAYANPISGQITTGQQIHDDIFYAYLSRKNLVNHELVHMKQYMLMGCSENGINKLNYISVKKAATLLDENDKKEVHDAYKEIQTGLSDYYKTATINVAGHDTNLADYITALHKVLFDKNATENDIPIIINKDFYEQARKAKGKLSPEEEKKAQEYFNAWGNYPQKLNIISAFNPFSSYRQNLLEKEAYKMNPWYIFTNRKPV